MSHPLTGVTAGQWPQVSHDLVVIGAGPAGLAAATFAARMGARVALVEANRVGGDCTWTGCVPSKALIHAAGLVHGARAGGFLQGYAAPDFDAVRAYVHQVRERVHQFESPARLAAQGVELVTGQARYLDAATIDVDGRRLSAPRSVICTGAVPAVPPIPGLDRVPYLTYRTVFEIDRLPARLLVVGGGPIGSELAQAFCRLGSRVTLVEALPRLVPVADPEAADLLAARFRREGIDLRLEAAVERVEPAPGGGVAAVVGGERIEADRLLLGVGRRACIEPLGLEAIGVAAGPRGVEVDAHLHTSVRRIYAAGDVTGGPQFTHYAAWQGFAAARNALFPGRQRGVREAVPWTVFTDPELARVGTAEVEARARHRKVEVHRLELERVDRAQTEGETDGFLKLLTVGRRQRVLGASIVGPHAGEVANQIAVAIEAGMGLPELARTVLLYPTMGFGVGQLAASARLAAASARPAARLLRRRGPR